MNKLPFILSLLLLLTVSCTTTEIEPMAEQPIMNEETSAKSTATSTPTTNDNKNSPAPSLTNPTAVPTPTDTNHTMIEETAVTESNKYQLTADPSWANIILESNRTADPALALKLIEEAATQFQTSSEKIIIHRFHSVTWNSSALGCPDPRARYMQVITPGYQIIVSIDKQYYAYHTDKKGRFILCDPRYMQPIDQSTTPADH